jgi:tRNA nucleotidyltransferase (CCA-adding enzyme)
MRDMGVLDFVSPTFSKMLDVYHDSDRQWHHGESVWQHTLDVLRRTPSTLTARLAALFHDIGKVVTEEKEVDKQGRPVTHFYEHAEYGVDLAKKALRELKYPIKTIDSVAAIVHAHMAFTSDPKTSEEGLETLRTFLQYVYNDLDDALAVVEADQANNPEEKAKIDKIKERINKLKDDDMRKGLLVPSGGTYKYIAPLSGDEIMSEFKEVTQGPLVGELRDRLKRMLLQGRFDDMDARQRTEEARKILQGLAFKQGWEKMLMQKVQSDIAKKTQKKNLYQMKNQQ